MKHLCLTLDKTTTRTPACLFGPGECPLVAALQSVTRRRPTRSRVRDQVAAASSARAPSTLRARATGRRRSPRTRVKGGHSSSTSS